MSRYCPAHFSLEPMPYSKRRAPADGKPAKEKPRQSAKRYMAWLLSRQGYSAKGLRDKLLSKEYPLEEIETALAWAQEHGFQSDETYAESRARSTSAKHGNWRLKQGLMQKGISEELATAQLENVAPEEDRVLDVVRKFLGKELTPELRQKVYRFLATRGFGSKPIKAAFKHLEEHLAGLPPEPEDDGL